MTNTNQRQIITESEVDKKFSDFVNSPIYNEEEKKLLEKAYKFAKIAHKDNTRFNGDIYINHPLEVAKIVAFDIELSITSVVAALFHDLVMNPDIDISFVDYSFEEPFADELKKLLNGLWKIKGISDYFESDKVVFYQKLIETIAEDLRIIYIKIADRLHNMRTLYALEPYRKLKISTETLYVYVPLAERFGLHRIKSELEDLSFKYLDEKNYNYIQQKIQNDESVNIMKLNRFALPIIDKLSKAKIKFEIISRQKSLYSIWKKMQRKNIDVDEVYDIFAMRIIFEPNNSNNEKVELRQIEGIIRSLYEIKEDRTRDWIDNPKDNGYMAIHLTTKSENSQWVEIQIRSKNMDYIAEHGLAAHWKYKGIEERKKELDDKIEQIKLKLKSIDKSKIDFSNDFKTLVGQPAFIYVYTPKGKQIILENGSNVIDFAFAIHTELGLQCIGAKINNIPKPIDYVLNTGDVIFILTSKKQEPKLNWLEIVKSERAKETIRQYLKEHSANEYEKGKKIVDQALETLKIEPSPELFKFLTQTFNKSKRDLFIVLGKNEISKEDLLKNLSKYNKRKFFFFKLISKNKNIELKDFITATCCNPIPGDDVIGVNFNNVTIIHKKDCSKVKDLGYSLDLFPLTWETYKAKSYYTKLEIEAENKKGIFFQISRILSQDLEVNIKSIFFDTIDDELLMSGWIEIYVLNNHHLTRIIDEIKALQGIIKVKRI